MDDIDYSEILSFSDDAVKPRLQIDFNYTNGSQILYRKIDSRFSKHTSREKKYNLSL